MSQSNDLPSAFTMKVNVVRITCYKFCCRYSFLSFMNGIFKEWKLFTFFYATCWSSWKTSNEGFNDELLILRLMNFRKLRSIKYLFPKDLIHNRWSDVHFKVAWQLIRSRFVYRISVILFIHFCSISSN